MAVRTPDAISAVLRGGQIPEGDHKRDPGETSYAVSQAVRITDNHNRNGDSRMEVRIVGLVALALIVAGFALHLGPVLAVGMGLGLAWVGGTWGDR